jgi:hypothetical protein
VAIQTSDLLKAYRPLFFGAIEKGFGRRVPVNYHKLGRGQPGHRRLRNRHRCHVKVAPQQTAAALCQVRVLGYHDHFSLELQSGTSRPLTLLACPQIRS